MYFYSKFNKRLLSLSHIKRFLDFLVYCNQQRHSVMPQIFFLLRQVENPSSSLQFRKSPASRSILRFLLPASSMVASPCNSQEAIFHRNIRNAGDKAKEALSYTARIAAAVLNLICGEWLARWRRKIPGRTLSLGQCINKSLTHCKI